MNRIQRAVAVFGGSFCEEREYQIAREIGRRLAREDVAVICGGGAGVMEAVCRGAMEEGGLTIGILPGSDAAEANAFVTIPIVTGLGIARNSIIARSAPVCLALFGKYGTLSEIGYALQLNKPVICLGRWQKIDGVIPINNAEEAVQEIKKLL